MVVSITQVLPVIAALQAAHGVQAVPAVGQYCLAAHGTAMDLRAIRIKDVYMSLCLVYVMIMADLHAPVLAVQQPAHMKAAAGLVARMDALEHRMRVARCQHQSALVMAAVR